MALLAAPNERAPSSTALANGFIGDVPEPREGEARFDGCSRLRAFLAVVLPVLRPGPVAAGSLAPVRGRNHSLFAPVLLGSRGGRTIPAGPNTLTGAGSAGPGAPAAGGTVAAVPVAIALALLRKRLTTGFDAGAVKGR